METMWLEVPGPGVQRGFGDPCGWRGCPLLMGLCGPVSLQRPGMSCWLFTLSPGSQLPSHQTGLLTEPAPSCSSSFVCGCILCLRGQGGNGAGQEECKPEVPGHSVDFFFFFPSIDNLDRTGIDIFYNFCPGLLGRGLGGL